MHKSNLIRIHSKSYRRPVIALLAFLWLPGWAVAEHPSLVMSEAGVEQMRSQLGNVPLFDETLKQVRAEVDAEIALGIDTPIPKDFSGGYTHQRHKQNFFIMQKAGALFQILEDEKYAIYIRDMLFQYEAMYQDLPLHPQTRSYARGKLFWQCLNDANWLVYTAQAYDAIYEWLSAEDRQRLEDNLFRPFADHISVDSPQFFNRVHNHSTWGAAAVGLIGLVMRDDELVERALYGIADDGLELGGVDNDGGFIKVEGQKAGYFANLEEPFSPDGYYTEGPYYQRYAMYPFLIFAQGLHNVRPEVGVFEYKEGVLLKGVDALLNLTDADGEFFVLNDAQKGMSYLNSGVVSAVNIAYFVGDRDPGLLSIAEAQGQVLLDDAGFAVALAIRDGESQPFQKPSVNLSDGADGAQGGLAILRQDALTAVFKYTSQGLSHGHYDKLSYSVFERGAEVLQDYGMVRFVNIGQKGGGNYLPENTSWAKQTIAHNTLVRDEVSHFEGRYEIGSQHHSELHFFDANDPRIQVVSATESNAYPGTAMRRTLAVIQEDGFEKPLILDVLAVESDNVHQYDLPFHYMGQMISASFDYTMAETPSVLGADNGYQHLFLEAVGEAPSGSAQFSWLGEQGFHTITTTTGAADELLMVRSGANDADFNLRRDAALVLRRTGTDDTVFASVIESHGRYDAVAEFAANSNSSIEALMVDHADQNYTAISVTHLDGPTMRFIVANRSADADEAHRLEIDGTEYRWRGPYFYQRL